MAAKKGGAKEKPKAEGKKIKPSSAKYKLYDGGKSKNPACPKCGAGTFLAVHKDRNTCGKCSYTEFKKQ